MSTVPAFCLILALFLHLFLLYEILRSVLADQDLLKTLQEPPGPLLDPNQEIVLKSDTVLNFGEFSTKSLILS